jgi:glycosyltransferase involved in cell wall biosynthesis
LSASITVVVPAYNEEVNLADTIASIYAAAGDCELEIVIVNDGSVDRTGEIADGLAKRDPRIRPIHQPRNMGLGQAYFTGVKAATKDFVVMIPGDNECGTETLLPLVAQLGVADILVPYPVNMEIRSVFRRVTSRSFTALVNLLAGLDLEYYNGTVVHRRELVQRSPVTSSGFAYQAKVLVHMIYGGATYRAVPIRLNRNKARASSAFRLKNVASVGRDLAKIAVFRLRRDERWLSG